MVVINWLNTCRWRVLVAASTGILVGSGGGGSGVGVPSVSREAGIWAATDTPGTKSHARAAPADGVTDRPLEGVTGVAAAVVLAAGVVMAVLTGATGVDEAAVVASFVRLDWGVAVK